jgi:hypothetical protein
MGGLESYTVGEERGLHVVAARERFSNRFQGDRSE